ncbi:uncharacterized protein [Palaemon carinicauda]|uniref:uncharacterized protein isoform X7 n=1 Tax=Palaemon carinicauda TaxID=392227 RepID=UPI0035B61D2A
MKTPVFLLLAVVNLIHCQDMERCMVFTQRAALEELKNIGEKLKGYETIQQKQDEIIDKLKGYEAIQQKQDEIMDKLMDVQQKMGNLETNVQELSRDTKQCLRGEDLKHLTNVSVEANHEIKSFHEEMSGIISLAEKDECSEGSNPCGARGTCHNSLFSFSCSCPSGFTWDGSDCADIDECAQGKGVCSPNAVCNNSIGSYSCSCNKPFEGDGRTSCEIQCRSPARFVKDLGCIKYGQNGEPFQKQTEFCRKEGGRMLQKFDSHHLTDIMNTFGYKGRGGRGWVGVYNGTWSTDKSLVPEDLWMEGSDRSDAKRLCGFLEWDDSSSIKVIQDVCSYRNYVWCQFPLP